MRHTLVILEDNAERVAQSLADSGWHVERILPYDDLRWIHQAWRPLIRRLIVDSAKSAPLPATAP